MRVVYAVHVWGMCRTYQWCVLSGRRRRKETAALPPGRVQRAHTGLGRTAGGIRRGICAGIRRSNFSNPGRQRKPTTENLPNKRPLPRLAATTGVRELAATLHNRTMQHPEARRHSGERTPIRQRRPHRTVAGSFGLLPVPAVQAY